MGGGLNFLMFFFFFFFFFPFKSGACRLLLLSDEIEWVSRDPPNPTLPLIPSKIRFKVCVTSTDVGVIFLFYCTQNYTKPYMSTQPAGGNPTQQVQISTSAVQHPKRVATRQLTAEQKDGNLFQSIISQLPRKKGGGGEPQPFMFFV